MFSLFITLLNLLAIISADPVREPIYSVINDGNNMVEVVGGEPATISDAPYQAYIYFDLTDTYCGASIIHKRVLLTAAHCVEAVNISNMQFGYGGINRTNLSYKINATRVIIHPKRGIQPYDADVAVVILPNDIVLSSNVKIIKLADKTPLNGTVAKVTGWGLDGYGYPTLLRRTELTIADHNECYTYFKDLNVDIRTDMLCAQSYVSAVGGGDSGGPLAVGDEQVGVVSFSSNVYRNPTIESLLDVAVFADVAVLKPWIEEQIVKYVE